MGFFNLLKRGLNIVHKVSGIGLQLMNPVYSGFYLITDSNEMINGESLHDSLADYLTVKRLIDDIGGIYESLLNLQTSKVGDGLATVFYEKASVYYNKDNISDISSFLKKEVVLCNLIELVNNKMAVISELLGMTINQNSDLLDDKPKLLSLLQSGKSVIITCVFQCYHAIRFCSDILLSVGIIINTLYFDEKLYDKMKSFTLLHEYQRSSVDGLPANFFPFNGKFEFTKKMDKDKIFEADYAYFYSKNAEMEHNMSDSTFIMAYERINGITSKKEEN
jgi:hypothetical protein